jgi:HlyD family secretion protein
MSSRNIRGHCVGVCLAVAWLAGGVRGGAPEKQLRLPARVVAAEQAELCCRVGGPVRQVAVDIGDAVRKGQVLLQVDAPEVEQELLKSKAQLQEAAARLELARLSVKIAEVGQDAARAQAEEAQARCKRERAQLDFHAKRLQRLQELERQKAVTADLAAEAAKELEASTAALAECEARLRSTQAAVQESVARRERALLGIKVAEAQVQVARAEVQRVEAVLAQTQVLAPFDGVVLRRNAATGTFVVPPAAGRAEPLLTVARLERVRVLADVPEADAARIAVGMPVGVRLDALPDRPLQGKITRLAPVLDPKEQTLRIEIDLPNPKGELRPGMGGTVSLHLAREP